METIQEWKENYRLERIKSNEVWKLIPGYDEYYVSSLGRVKSLKFGREKIMNTWLNKRDYFVIRLSKKTEPKQLFIKVHQLVAMAFLEHKPDGTQNLVVNHIDFDTHNNCVDNLEIITHRENANRKHCKSSSSYTGVSLCKKTNNWSSSIFVNGKTKHLGTFDNEIDASKYYEKALLCVKENRINEIETFRKFASKYKGVTLDKKSGKWNSKIYINAGKNGRFLGRFETELEAHNRYQEELLILKQLTQ